MDATGWANWCIMETDAIYPHQIPECLRPLHERIRQAVILAIRQDREEVLRNIPVAKIVEVAS